MTLARRFRFGWVTVCGALVASCSGTGAGNGGAVDAVVTVAVAALGETAAVATANEDAADDPAIWRNAADPAASLIVGTDKKAGLYVYGLDGKVRHFLNAGQVNNVDLIDGVAIGGEPGILVAASDRSDEANAAIALFRLDPATGKLAALGKVRAGKGEAYGLCLYRLGDAVHAFLVTKEGAINQVALDLSRTPRGAIVRSMKLGSQSEGCVVDERTHRLYVGEEEGGVWRFDARPGGGTEPTAVTKADGLRLVADVEGLAIAPEGADGGYLIASSQGDNAYALYRLTDGGFAGRFRIAPGKFGSTEETDGIALALGSFGAAYPDGLFIAQDGENAPAAQNFKLVSWADVKRELRLD